MRKLLTAVLLCGVSGQANANYFTGANTVTNVVPNYQTYERFLANWQSLAKSATNRMCDNGYCRWEWQLHGNVRAMMYESMTGKDDAAYCFVVSPSIVWDCYSRDGAKWNWTYDTLAPQQTAPQQVAPAASAPSTSAVISDGKSMYVSVMFDHWKAHMLVDTGATGMQVVQGLADNLIRTGDAHYTGEMDRGQIADGSIVSEPEISIDHVTVNGHTFTNVLAAVSQSDTNLLPFPLIMQSGLLSAR